MSKKIRFITAISIGIALALIPASASANIGGAAPRIHSTDTDDDVIKNIGGARGAKDGGDALVENIGGASPREKNIGGAGPRSTDTLQENIGGASPRGWSNWLLDLLTLG